LQHVDDVRGAAQAQGAADGVEGALLGAVGPGLACVVDDDHAAAAAVAQVLEGGDRLVVALVGRGVAVPVPGAPGGVRAEGARGGGGGARGGGWGEGGGVSMRPWEPGGQAGARCRSSGGGPPPSSRCSRLWSRLGPSSRAR